MSNPVRTGADIAKELNQVVFSYGVLSLQEKDLQDQIDALEDRFFALKKEHIEVTSKEQAPPAPIDPIVHTSEPKPNPSTSVDKPSNTEAVNNTQG